MRLMDLSKRDARKIFLQQQGLLQANSFGSGKSAALAAIRQLTYLQIDTISVVSRAHEHILQNRIQRFNGEMLNELMLDRSLYEYWSHAAAYLPIENFRFSLPVMQGRKHARSIDNKQPHRFYPGYAVMARCAPKISQRPPATKAVAGGHGNPPNKHWSIFF